MTLPLPIPFTIGLYTPPEVAPEDIVVVPPENRTTVVPPEDRTTQV